MNAVLNTSVNREVHALPSRTTLARRVPYAAALVLLAFGCHAQPLPTVQTAAASSSKSDALCPLVPLKLVLRSPHQSPQTMLTLDASGRLNQVAFGNADIEVKPFARLDPRGCLVASDGLIVEATRSGQFWTPHQLFEFRESFLLLPGGRAITIARNGAVESFAKDGSLEPDTVGTFAFEGYSESAACAARILWITFAMMMPSMAVSDGHPAQVPPPSESTCPDLEAGSLAK